MIITKDIEVTATGVLLKHLKNLGYDIKSHQKLKIPVKDLPENTRKIVLARCDVCGKEYEITYKNYLLSIKNGGYLSCNKCKGEKSKNTCLEKYGVENPSQLEEIKERKKETLFNNYDTYNVFDISNETIKEKYGVDNVFQSEEIKEKIKETNLKKYGVENPQQNKEIKEKTLETNLERYSVKHPLQSEEIKIKLKNTQKQNIKNKYSDLDILDIDDEFNIKIRCEKNHIYEINSTLIYDRLYHNSILCTECNPINSYSSSGKEKQLLSFIEEHYTGEIIKNNRKIIGKELDIYLPELKLAFEFNGVYWHNELNKPNNYHKIKSDLCDEKGIQLIHIWEDDWLYKEDIVKSMILNKLGKTTNRIFGRKCVIKEITDNKIIRDFLNNNHIQGFVGSTTKIGLYYDNELVSLMTFTKRKEGYELSRFCNKLNTTIIGGASKLLKYFTNNNSVNVYTFSDRVYSNGELYEKIGFKYDSFVKPSYYYVVGDKRKHKFNFRGKNERKNMLKQKIYRIYDAGKIKYIL